MTSGCDYDSLRVSKNPSVEHIGKSKKKVSAVVLVFVTVLIILNLVKFASSSNSQKIKRIKRHIPDFAKNRITTSDIEILPGNRKIYHHPNHRYEEEGRKNEKKIKNRLKSRKDWSGRLSQSKRDKHPKNIQDVILKGKFPGTKGNGQSKIVNELLKGSGSTMRLRGVYVHPESEDDLPESQLGRTYYDSTEINDLMKNNSSIAEKPPVKRGFKSPGAPFQLPVKGREDPRRQTPNHRSKTRPITIYLDFYPENHPGEYKRRKPEWNAITPSKNKFRNRLPSQSMNVGKFLLPDESPGGILMKLNLYPKESAISKRNSGRQISRFQRSKRPEKKSEEKKRWFSKDEKKKNNPKECSIAGLNPRGNRITAKWKNENGEWIHAEHVDVKYLKKD